MCPHSSMGLTEVSRKNRRAWQLACGCVIGLAYWCWAEVSAYSDPDFVVGALPRAQVRRCVAQQAAEDSIKQGELPAFSRRTALDIFNAALLAYAAYKVTRLPFGGYIAALGDPSANSGNGAELWGIWRQDPGPQGVGLSDYDQLKANNGVAPANWTLDGADWWLEEHGLIMPKPEGPLPPGKYKVTGDREVTSILTVYPKDEGGNQRWELSDGAKLYDVTHLPCRSARYTPEQGENSCSPAQAVKSDFPVTPGAPMPPVRGCRKQDHAVLFVLGF